MSEIEEPSKEFLARKEFLLHQARRARMKFVLQARDSSLETKAIVPKEKSDSHDENGNDGLEKTSSATKLAQQQRNKVPAAECVQQVLDFFHHLLPDDTEAVDVDQLLLSVQDTDVEEDLRNFQATAGSGSLSDYDLFLRKLLLPQAAHIVKMLQQFVLKTQARYRNLQLLPTSAFGMNSGSQASNISASVQEKNKNQPTGPLKAEEVWDFIDHVCQAMQETELWASGPGTANTNQVSNTSVLTSAAALAQLSSNNNDGTSKATSSSSLLPLDASVEVFVERLVFRKIGDYLFAGNKDEARKNHLTTQRIHALQFVTAEHLDIRSLQGMNATEISMSIANPCESLLKLSQRVSPSDKVHCLRQCCQQIAQLLKQLKLQRDQQASSSSHHPGNAMTALPGADELLPMMIYVVLKTPIPELHSQIRFLQNYTRPRQMLSEAGYLVTQFVSAVYFLDNVDARALMIEPDAFDQAMLQAKQRAKSELLQAQQAQQAQILSNSKRKSSANSSLDAASHIHGAETLDLHSILAQYKAEMKNIDQQFQEKSSSDSSSTVSTTTGPSSTHQLPSLREYRLQYLQQQPKSVSRTTRKA